MSILWNYRYLLKTIINSIRFLLNCWILIFEHSYNLLFLTLLWTDLKCKLSFLQERSYFLDLKLAEFQVHGVFNLSETNFSHSKNILTQLFYLYIDILISHNIFNIFWPFNEFHAKLNNTCRDALYFMMSFLHWKFLTFFRENSCKIVNTSKNIIKFYRYVKYFRDVISFHFLLTLTKGETGVRFLK